MKNLIAAICSVAVLVGGWLIFAHYSEGEIDSITNSIKKEILPAVEQSDWKSSKEKIDKLNDEWHDYRKTAIFFLNTEAINEIDYSLAKSIKYVYAEDVSNSSGELNAMSEQLDFLCRNDEVNWSNIF